jgi:peptide/nickel transport system permease protein
MRPSITTANSGTPPEWFRSKKTFLKGRGHRLHRVAQHAATILLTVLLGGLLGATLVRFAPGFGVAEEELDIRRSSASIEALRQANSSESNVFVFYAHYLQRMAHGDLGFSRTLNRPVTQLLAERFPETLKSVTLGVLLGWTLGMAFAIAASLISGVFLCVPAAVLALVFVLSRAPTRLILAFIVFPKVFRYARNLLLRSANLPHVLTAYAKGLSKFRVFCWHVLPNAAPQLLALAGVSVSLAFAASIPVEALCDLPGIGQLAWKAALGRDLYLLVNLTMVVTVLVLAANSFADLLSPRRSPA